MITGVAEHDDVLYPKRDYGKLKCRRYSARRAAL
jgi:hypothetical protein